LDWERKVTGILASMSLIALIERSILRPRKVPGDAMARKWRVTSIMVGAWLLSGVSSSLYKKIKLDRANVKFADDVWDKLMFECEFTKVHCDMRTCKAFLQITASDYNNIEAYTTAYLAGCLKMKEAGYNPSSFELMAWFILGVETVAPLVATRVLNRLDAEGPGAKYFTQKHFYEVVHEV
jgi:hypothetical protein